MWFILELCFNQQPSLFPLRKKQKTKQKTKNYGWLDSCIRVYLEIVYLTETEFWIKLKGSKNSTVGFMNNTKKYTRPMNNSKNKLNSSKSWFFKPMLNAHEKCIRPMNSTKKYNETYE